MASALDIVDIEHLHPQRKFYWATLMQMTLRALSPCFSNQLPARCFHWIIRLFLYSYMSNKHHIHNMASIVDSSLQLSGSHSLACFDFMFCHLSKWIHHLCDCPTTIPDYYLSLPTISVTSNPSAGRFTSTSKTYPGYDQLLASPVPSYHLLLDNSESI